MDNLVLERLAIDLEAELAGSVFEQFRQETNDRFRLIFARDAGPLGIVVSLDPELPWIGAPPFRWEGPRWSPDPGASALSKSLAGLRLARVTKAPADRSVRLEAADGSGLIVELLPHASNLVLLGPGGVIETALRLRRRSAERLTPGKVWTPAPPPPGRGDPFTASPAELNETLDRWLGLGPVAGGLAREEAERTGRCVGEVLAERLAEVKEGRSEVVVAGPIAPREAILAGTFRAPSYRLLPWRPPGEAEGPLWEERSGLSTAGLFHDGLETVGRLRRRIAALDRILASEIRKAVETGARVELEQRRFEAPDDLARQAEALLAGLTRAERRGDRVAVPDPYDPGGAPVLITAPPGVPLPEVANALFRKSRRARRGRDAASARASALALRAARLESLAGRARLAIKDDDASALEGAMRDLGIAVGLVRATRAGRAADRLESPQPAGIRVLTSADGWSILVGKTARDNDRLTFKLAGPDDLWLHAAGATGAHVVVKTSERGGDVPETTLNEAAQAAAWFSDARSHGTVEVHWTRRKHVRRVGGASPGRVVLKRFQTVRVRAIPPRERD